MFLAVIFLTACGTTVQPKYYLLTPAASTATGAATGEQQLVISVGPVNLPEYLDRRQIVIRRSGTELDLADGHRWAGPLPENFTRVLADNLYNLMGSGKVITFPARESAAIDYRITVAVSRFDATAQGVVMLHAHWSIYAGNDMALLLSRRAEYSLNVDPDAGYEQIVTALSSTIGLLGRDIYTAITALAAPD